MNNFYVSLKRSSPQRTALIAALLLIVGWLIFDWFQSRDREMSEMPPRSAAATAIEPRESTLLATVLIPYAAIEKVANTEAAKLAGTKSDNLDLKCVSSDFPRIRECLTVNYTVNYSINGPVTINRAENRLRITVPAQFKGQAGIGRHSKFLQPKCEKFFRLIYSNCRSAS